MLRYDVMQCVRVVAPPCDDLAATVAVDLECEALERGE